MIVGYSFTGIEQLTALSADLTKTAARAASEVARVVGEKSQEVETQAKAYVPVRTGALRDSITHEVTHSVSDAEGIIGPTATYGGYIEYGTSRMSPRPYLGPALDEVGPKLEAAIGAIAAQGLL